LEHFSGILQTDGYSGYNAFRRRTDIVNLGCWDHARRKFVDAIKVAGGNKSGVSGEMVKLINKLYKIEREHKNASIEKRYLARQKYARPILEALYKKAEQINVLPKSTLGNAFGYLKNNKPYLIAYIERGDTHLSNCLMENQIRPFALGRKNWMFVGNEVSANKSALLYSLIQTCKLNKINPLKYLIAVLNRVHTLRRGEVEPKSLLPQFIDLEIL